MGAGMMAQAREWLERDGFVTQRIDEARDGSVLRVHHPSAPDHVVVLSEQPGSGRLVLASGILLPDQDQARLASLPPPAQAAVRRDLAFVLNLHDVAPRIRGEGSAVQEVLLAHAVYEDGFSRDRLMQGLAHLRSAVVLGHLRLGDAMAMAPSARTEAPRTEASPAAVPIPAPRTTASEACGRCGAANPPASRFCLACGAAFGAQAPAAVPAPRSFGSNFLRVAAVTGLLFGVLLLLLSGRPEPGLVGGLFFGVLFGAILALRMRGRTVHVQVQDAQRFRARLGEAAGRMGYGLASWDRDVATLQATRGAFLNPPIFVHLAPGTAALVGPGLAVQRLHKLLAA